MRIWDISPRRLCRQHLLGEHRELHALWIILTQNKRGYRNHPETKRWVGKLRALYQRHGLLVVEMSRRGYHHRTPLDKRYAKGSAVQKHYLNHPRSQIKILREKPCDCLLR